MSRRRLLRAYTIAVALVCCAAVTLVAHDDPAADAAGARTARCEAWEARLAALQVRHAALERELAAARRALHRLAVSAPRRRRALLRTLAAARRAAVRRARATLAQPLHATHRPGR
jgi:hypothetical protein